MNVKEFLDDRGIAFDVVSVADSQDGRRVDVVGRSVARIVLLKADRGYTFVVGLVPAGAIVDLAKISAVMGGSKIELATRFDLETYCPDSEPGGLLPFGTHYGLRTLVDASLVDADDILFEGSTPGEVICMGFDDFQRIESPLVAGFAIRPEEVA